MNKYIANRKKSRKETCFNPQWKFFISNQHWMLLLSTMSTNNPMPRSNTFHFSLWQTMHNAKYLFCFYFLVFNYFLVASRRGNRFTMAALVPFCIHFKSERIFSQRHSLEFLKSFRMDLMPSGLSTQ